MVGKRGEVTTVFMIAVFLFVGVASLFSSRYLSRSTNLTSRASSCNRPTCIYSQIESDGIHCYEGNSLVESQPVGFNVNCGWVAGCSTGKRVVCPGYNNLSPVPVSQTGGNQSGQQNEDGGGGACGPFRGGADSRGCGGADGCRPWEKCQNGVCYDTTDLGNKPPAADSCGATTSNIASTPTTTPTSMPTPTLSPAPQIGVGQSAGGSTRQVSPAVNTRYEVGCFKSPDTRFIGLIYQKGIESDPINHRDFRYEGYYKDLNCQEALTLTEALRLVEEHQRSTQQATTNQSSNQSVDRPLPPSHPASDFVFSCTQGQYGGINYFVKARSDGSVISFHSNSSCSDNSKVSDPVAIQLSNFNIYKLAVDDICRSQCSQIAPNGASFIAGKDNNGKCLCIFDR